MTLEFPRTSEASAPLVNQWVRTFPSGPSLWRGRSLTSDRPSHGGVFTNAEHQVSYSCLGAAQDQRTRRRLFGVSIKSISMFSRTADTCISGGDALAKLTELKCDSSHSCPPSGSADRFSETANRIESTGLRLEIR